MNNEIIKNRLETNFCESVILTLFPNARNNTLEVLRRYDNLLRKKRDILKREESQDDFWDYSFERQHGKPKPKMTLTEYKVINKTIAKAIKNYIKLQQVESGAIDEKTLAFAKRVGQEFLKEKSFVGVFFDSPELSKSRITLPVFKGEIQDYYFYSKNFTLDVFDVMFMTSDTNDVGGVLFSNKSSAEEWIKLIGVLSSVNQSCKVISW